MVSYGYIYTSELVLDNMYHERQFWNDKKYTVKLVISYFFNFYSLIYMYCTANQCE